MAMLSKAILAVWNDVLPDLEAAFNDWYIKDHLPDRVALPGFHRGRRWLAAGAGPRYFTFYEIDDVGVMRSDAYIDRHENPTAGTRRMMPGFVGMNRSICRVTAGGARGDGGVAGVLRVTPAAGREADLRRWIAETTLPAISARPGILGACLWELDREASAMPSTAETRLRATADAVIDWAIVVEASRLEELDAAGSAVDSTAANAAGAASLGPLEAYRLLCSLCHDTAVTVVPEARRHGAA